MQLLDELRFRQPVDSWVARWQMRRTASGHKQVLGGVEPCLHQATRDLETEEGAEAVSKECEWPIKMVLQGLDEWLY